MKRCCTCKQELAISNFSKNRSAKDGLNKVCKSCVSDKNKRYRKENTELLRARNKIWSNNNKAAIKNKNKNWYDKGGKEYLHNYRKKHREDLNTKHKAWQKKNPEKLKAYSKKTIQTLSDGYMVRHIMKSGISKEKITPDLIKATRVILKLKRLIKTKQNGKRKKTNDAG